MPAAQLRDLEMIADGLRRWFHARDPDDETEIVGLRHASAGWANETIVVTVVQPENDASSTRPSDRLVLRLPPQTATFPEYSLRAQATIQMAVERHGIPAPTPASVEDDGQWLGAPFLVMPFIDGHVPGQAPALDPWITGLETSSQSRLYEDVIDILAALHRVDPEAAGLSTVLRGAGSGLQEEVGWWERYATWSAAGDPVLTPLAEGLAWCRREIPGEEPPACVLWGDARLGNVVADDAGRVIGVLDWEMASLGPAELDLGWFLGLEWMMAELVGSVVPGFPDRRATLTRYERALGRPTRDLDWFEIFALVRSVAVNDHLARIAAANGESYLTPSGTANPMVSALERRIAAVG